MSIKSKGPKTTIAKDKTSKKNIKERADDISVPSGTLSDILSKRKDMQKREGDPKIAVIGVGGGGCNMINNLVKSGLTNVCTIACNTDNQSLKKSLAEYNIQLGQKTTHGHGAGANKEIGKLAVQESEEEIRKHLEGIHMAFVVAGMGGGTGTGSAPAICRIALDMGILILGFAITPFEFEGVQRKAMAESGLADFQDSCDVLIVVGNQNLFSVSNESTTFVDAFAMADEVLCAGVQSVVKTISQLGLINTDLADFFTIMKGRKSRARMGTGLAVGEDRGLAAAEEAMANPLLQLDGLASKDIDRVIICIQCGNDMTLSDINQAVDYVKQSVSSDANIIFGATIDETMTGKVQVSVFATSSNEKPAQEKENEYIVKDVAGPAREEMRFNFQELIADEMEIGAPHKTEYLHEDNLNKQLDMDAPAFIVSPKKGWIRRFFSFFFASSKKNDIPPYLK